jgi:hypothetical protein
VAGIYEPLQWSSPIKFMSLVTVKCELHFNGLEHRFTHLPSTVLLNTCFFTHCVLILSVTTAKKSNYPQRIISQPLFLMVTTGFTSSKRTLKNILLYLTLQKIKNIKVKSSTLADCTKQTVTRRLMFVACSRNHRCCEKVLSIRY